MKNCFKPRNVFSSSFSQNPLFLCWHLNNCKQIKDEGNLSTQRVKFSFFFSSHLARERGVSQCAICIVFMPCWVLCIQPCTFYLALIHTWWRCTLSDQTLALKSHCLPGLACPRGGGVVRDGCSTLPCVPTNSLCFLPRKQLSGKGLLANKADLNQ